MCTFHSSTCTPLRMCRCHRSQITCYPDSRCTKHFSGPMLQVWLTCASHSKTHTPFYYGLNSDFVPVGANVDSFKYNHKTRILLQNEGFSVWGSSWFSNFRVTCRQKGVRSVTIVPKHWISTPTWTLREIKSVCDRWRQRWDRWGEWEELQRR